MDEGFFKESCSCQGNNPSCFKCGGWGYIDVIGSSRAAAGAGELAPRGAAKKREKSYAQGKVKNQKTG